MKSAQLILLTSIITYLLPFSANAQIIKVDYTGTVTSIGSLLIGNGVAIDDAMSGSFSYDTNPSGAGLISFANSFSNGFTATMTGSGNLTVQNDQQNGSATLPADSFIVGSSSTSNTDWNGLTNPYMQFGLRQENIAGQLWDDTVPPDLSDWALITLGAINAPGWRILDFAATGTSHFSDDQLRWEVDAFSVIPVPAAVWLFGTSIFGLLGFSRKKVN